MKKLTISLGNSEGVLEDLTAEEIAQSETDTQNYLAREEERETSKQAKEDLKASAKAKLVAGEALTQEEADTIVL